MEGQQMIKMGDGLHIQLKAKETKCPHYFNLNGI